MPIAIAELLNGGRISPIILPFLLIGVVIGARRGWPRWSLWWLGWTLCVATLSTLLWLHSPGRPAMIYFLWELILAVILLSIGVAIWQRGDGFRVAFTMFPCALEFVRFVFFDDLPRQTYQFLFARVTFIFVYAGAFVLVKRRSLYRTQWSILIGGMAVCLIVTVIISLPVIAVFVVFPTYIPLLVLLAFESIIIGLGLNGYRARYRLSALVRITLLAVIVSSLFCVSIPWLAGDVLDIRPHASASTQKSDMRRAVIIDTDLSHDDYVAILYLLQHPTVDILGITVVDGFVHAEPGLENIQRLLALANYQDVPIAAGPLSSQPSDDLLPNVWRSTVDFGLRPVLPKPAIERTLVSASDLICQLITDSPTPVTYIALGPLTNLAQALRDNPDQVSRLDAVFFSGGLIGTYNAVADSSSHNIFSDWNLLLDPGAADLIFRAGIPVVLIPPDVTNPHGSNPILVTNSLVNHLKYKVDARESWVMVRIMSGWLSIIPNADSVPLWDAVTAAIVTDSMICTDWRDMSIRVVLKPDIVAGKIVADEIGQPNARVCLAGDQTAFEEAFLETAH